MAIKVRCDNCRKKISIDEAFAGGVCRCPYCGALKLVSGGPADAPAHRPARPGRPDRPDAPGAAAAPSEPGPTPREHIPVAKPVMVQGVVAMILIGLLVLLLAFSVIFLMPLLLGERGGGDGSVPANPVAEGGTQVLGLEFDTPVVFVIDAGSGSRDAFDPSAALVRHAIIGLKSKHKFNLLLAREQDLGIEKLAPDWQAAGLDGDTKVKAFLAEKMVAGASDLDGAVTQAINLSPKSVVLLTGKAPSAPAALADAAKAKGVTIVTVSVGNDPMANDAAKVLAEKSGGAWKGIKLGELLTWFEAAPPLP